MNSLGRLLDEIYSHPDQLAKAVKHDAEHAGAVSYASVSTAEHNAMAPVAIIETSVGWPASMQTHQLALQLAQQVDLLRREVAQEIQPKANWAVLFPLLREMKRSHRSLINGAVEAANNDKREIEPATIERFWSAFGELFDWSGIALSGCEAGTAPAAAVENVRQEWTRAKVDASLRVYFEQHKEAYEAAKSGKLLHKQIRDIFGRNSISRKLKIRSERLVGESPVWITYADAIGLRKHRGGRRIAIGHDIAVDEKAELLGDTTAFEIEKREIIKIIERTKLLAGEHDEVKQQAARSAMIDELASGRLTLDRAAEALHVLAVSGE